MRQGNFSPVKNSPRGQRDLVPTGSTLPPSLVHQFIGSSMSASRTDEAIGPATGRQVLLASLVCGEVGLKLVYCLRKRRSGHPFTLPIGACWSNQISISRLTVDVTLTLPTQDSRR